jgi:hypothetical protein
MSGRLIKGNDFLLWAAEKTTSKLKNMILEPGEGHMPVVPGMGDGEVGGFWIQSQLPKQNKNRRARGACLAYVRPWGQFPALKKECDS